MEAEFGGGKSGDRVGALAHVEEHLTRCNITLREIFDSNDLPYNQIRAVIVGLMFGVIYSD